MRDGFLKIGLLPAILILIMIAFEPPGVSLPSLTAAVIHECGHLFAARLLKIELRSLDIGPLGATIRTRGSLISYGCEWLLCAAGSQSRLRSRSIHDLSRVGKIHTGRHGVRLLLCFAHARVAEPSARRRF